MSSNHTKEKTNPGGCNIMCLQIGKAYSAPSQAALQGHRNKKRRDNRGNDFSSLGTDHIISRDYREKTQYDQH